MGSAVLPAPLAAAGHLLPGRLEDHPQLTLNLGLRYDISFGPTEMHNRHSSFDPFVISPVTGMPGVLKYAGVDGPPSYVDLDKNNFGPRVGFAWDPGATARPPSAAATA
jgi:hypothetical protein